MFRDAEIYSINSLHKFVSFTSQISIAERSFAAARVLCVRPKLTETVLQSLQMLSLLERACIYRCLVTQSALIGSQSIRRFYQLIVAV